MKKVIEVKEVNEVMVMLGMKEVKKVESVKIDEVVEVLKGKIENKEISKSEGIKSLFKLGMEVKEISNSLGIIYNMCYNVISNYCVVNKIEVVKVKKESKKDKVIEMLEEGKGNMEICRELLMNYNYVLKIKKEWLKSKEVVVENVVNE